MTYGCWIQKWRKRKFEEKKEKFPHLSVGLKRFEKKIKITMIYYSFTLEKSDKRRNLIHISIFYFIFNLKNI